MSRSTPGKSRNAFCPSLSESPLEDRLVLSTGVGGTVRALVAALTPADPPFTPPPAAPPFTPGTSTAQVRQAILQQTHTLATNVRQAIGNQATVLFANGRPNAQQLANFDASVQGIANAAALQLSSQAALLPGSASRLVPGLQNLLLGGGSNGLVSRIQSLAASGRTGASLSSLQTAVSRQLNTTFQGTTAQLNNFFDTTSLNRLSVNAAGQRVPLSQFMGSQLVSQVSNTLGLLAKSFPGVANATLFPNGTTGANGLPITPSASVLSAFRQQANNALQTAAFQLGSALAILPGGSSRIGPTLQPILFGSGTGAASLASSLQNLQFGSTGFNSAVSSAFNNSFQSLSSTLSPLLGLTSQSNATLPTSGFTNLFGSNFTSNAFANGFNNGFASAPSNGFIGFGQAPTAFNNTFANAFNNFVGTQATNFGLGTSSTTTFGQSTGTAVGQVGGFFP